MFGGRGWRSYGRSDGRSLRAQALLTGLLVMAGPSTTPVEAEEIVAAGATAALHVSRPWQALLGPRRFASVDNSGVPIVGPGATVGLSYMSAAPFLLKCLVSSCLQGKSTQSSG